MDNNKHEDEEIRYVSDEELNGMLEVFGKRLKETGNRSLIYDFKLMRKATKTKLSEKNELIESDILMPSMKNRKGLEKAIMSESARADRANYGIKPGEPLRYLFSLAEIDINYFKRVNDTYGHPEGDNFLKFLESSFKEITPRAEDIIGRWGGDEIILLLPQPILPGRDPESASPENIKKRVLVPLRERFYEKTKERLSELKDETGKPFIINGIEADGRGIGLSIGITNYPLLSKSHLDIVSDVDEAMYKAKALKNKPSDSEGNYKGHIVIFEKPKWEPNSNTNLREFFNKSESEEILGGRLVRSILNSSYYDPIEGKKRVRTIRDLLKTYHSVGWSKKSFEKINTMLANYNLPQMGQKK